MQQFPLNTSLNIFNIHFLVIFLNMNNFPRMFFREIISHNWHPLTFIAYLNEFRVFQLFPFNIKFSLDMIVRFNDSFFELEFPVKLDRVGLPFHFFLKKRWFFNCLMDLKLTNEFIMYYYYNTLRQFLLTFNPNEED